MGVVAGYLGAAPTLLWAVGALTLVFAPVLILVSIWLYTLVFAFAALWFAHYLLAALRGAAPRRGAAGPAPRRGRARGSPLAAPARPRRMNFGLIIIGDEILSGKRADKHLPKVIELLAARGLALELGPLCRRRPGSASRPTSRDAFAQRRRSCSPAAASARRRTTTRGNARRRRSASPLALHPQARDLILERMRDVAREQGMPFEPDRDDNRHRLNMGVFPDGAEIIPNPVQQDRRASRSVRRRGRPRRRLLRPRLSGDGLADDRMGARHALCRRCIARAPTRERSVIVFGAMEATLTPLMEAIEARFAGVKVFSLPSVDHPAVGPTHRARREGRRRRRLEAAYAELLAGLRAHGAALGPELVR